MRTFIKRLAEFAYWFRHRLREGRLSHEHYEYWFTAHFGIDKQFYSGKRLLDVGCGPRGSLEWASQAKERVGLDPLADKYRRLGTATHRMRYVNSGAEVIPFPDDYFDVVSTFNSLDHVDDLDAAVTEICRVLKPGGLLLLLTDVNHAPTVKEPLSLDWDVLDRFVPPLHVVRAKQFEKVVDGIYNNIRRDHPYDQSDPRDRPGVISAALSK